VTDDKKLDYEVQREGDRTVLLIDYTTRGRIPSIEDDEITMSEAITLLIENPTASKLLFTQKHDYEYDFTQVALISEIARLYNKLVKNKELFSYPSLARSLAATTLTSKYNELHNVLFAELKKDPIACYVQIKRIRRREQIQLDKEIEEVNIKSHEHYIKLLDYILGLLEATKLITVAKPYIEG
jgi:hypothetical protein